MPSPILARADALMQRRRQAGEPEDVPILTDSVDEADEEDIPVLLDIADETVRQEEKKPPLPGIDPETLDLLGRELTRRVEQRLAAELPRIIESTVRDFLAEQEMIAAQQAND